MSDIFDEFNFGAVHDCNIGAVLPTAIDAVTCLHGCRGNLVWDFGSIDTLEEMSLRPRLIPFFDYIVCLELVEVSNLHYLLDRIKRLLKLGGWLCAEIPDHTKGMNVLYPGLFFPYARFIQFMAQMSFPWLRRVYRTETQTHLFVFVNEEIKKRKMLF